MSVSRSGTAARRRMLAARGRATAESSICLSCLHHTTRHSYSTSTIAAAPSTSPRSIPPLSHIPPVTSLPAPVPAYTLKAGIVLSRPPQITRTPTPFESSVHLYNRRLNERLSLPCTKYFYFKPGTPADLEWKRKIKERLTPARDIGRYNPYGEEGWNDEVLVGDQTRDVKGVVGGLMAEDGDGSIGGRRTEKEEVLSGLDRELERNVYLVVSKGDGKWEFPAGGLIGREALHQAAERILVQSAGINMNTWVVGHAPIGHHHLRYAEPQLSHDGRTQYLGEKTFFMKARLMAGQADLSKNAVGLQEFRWLNREEVQEVVRRGYWAQVKGMLAQR